MITEEEKKQIEEHDEVTLYFVIDMLGGMIWRTQHDASHGRLTITDEMKLELQGMSDTQQECVKQLTKFGIDPESVKDRVDGDYWKWYRHWDSWKKAMTDKEWVIFDERYSNLKENKEGDVSDLLPKNKWNEKSE